MTVQWVHGQEWPCWQGRRLIHRLSDMDLPSPRLTYWVPDLPTAETRDQYWVLIWALSDRLLTLDPFYHGKDSNLLSLEKTHYLGMALLLVLLSALLSWNSKGVCADLSTHSSSPWWLRKTSRDVKHPHAQVSFGEKAPCIFSFPPSFPNAPPQFCLPILSQQGLRWGSFS